MKRLSYLIIMCACALLCACESDKEHPVVKTCYIYQTEVTALYANSADISIIVGVNSEKGYVDPYLSPEIKSYGVYYSETTNRPTASDGVVEKTTSDSPYELMVTVTNLKEKTLYYARAFIKDALGSEILGDVIEFTTTKAADDKVIMSFTEITNITENSAQLNGKITIGADVLSSITEFGYVYSDTYSLPDLSNGKRKRTTNIPQVAGRYNLNWTVDELSGNTTYYVRMYYKTNSSNIYDETVKSFTTLPPTVNPPAGDAITIAQFKSKPDDMDTWYTLTGVIYDIESTTYGNFYLVDETGVLYVYGLTATKMSGNDQSFSSLGLKTGDYITISAPKNTYGGLIEAKNGYLVSKNAKLTYSTSFNTYVLEPTTTQTFTFSATPSRISMSCNESKQSEGASSDESYYMLHIDDAVGNLFIVLNALGLHDPVTAIPVGTYPVVDDFYPDNAKEKSEGYAAYLNFNSPPRFVSSSSSTYGYKAPYYITGGQMTVSKSGDKTRLQFNFTTYNGSIIKGDMIVDLLSVTTVN